MAKNTKRIETDECNAPNDLYMQQERFNHRNKTKRSPQGSRRSCSPCRTRTFIIQPKSPFYMKLICF